ncbi:unnamed protein product [Clonostachys byssicola]|uniref:DUF924-domain-containing protein n=1 Tax=Clonostachys byssicola TaxID=160290 RepID=A0A9N9UJ77_9HYPO|nr:unnamed protein product [Clonostachys byssicola]
MASVKEAVTPALLAELRAFWFGHFESQDAYALPGQKDLMPWFMGGKALDDICIERYTPALEAIQASGITSGKDLVEAVAPATPMDWLSLVLLLDQVPRNCYRGASSRLVYSVFDPIALGVATEAIERGVVDQTPEIRWFCARRMWFYLPLMHSEDMATHERAMAAYQGMVDDVEALIAGEGVEEGGCEQKARAAKVLQRDPEGARSMVKLNFDLEKKHYDIVRQFGRYPHRNGPLGREMTAEEQKYLDDGGETFTS